MAANRHDTLTPVLDGNLQVLERHTKDAILSSLWPGKAVVSNSSSLGADSYFGYYRSQSSAFSDGLCIDYNIKPTHHDVVKTVGYMKDSLATRELVVIQVSNLFSDRWPAEHITDLSSFAALWIDFVLRLWLMIYCGEIPYFITPGQIPVQVNEQILSATLARIFPSSTQSDSVTLKSQFKAQNLDEIGGIGIVWTDNLVDHLLLVENDTFSVCIFHHASFLKLQADNPVFPAGLIEETLRTLSILLPPLDKRSRKWFEKQSSSSKLDELAHKLNPSSRTWRRVGPQGFWTERLLLWQQVYDDAEPRTVAQWWRDRRRRTAWYTFWVAILILILTIFFGLVQSMEGALQVYKAYYPSQPVP